MQVSTANSGFADFTSTSLMPGLGMGLSHIQRPFSGEVLLKLSSYKSVIYNKLLKIILHDNYMTPKALPLFGKSSNATFQVFGFVSSRKLDANASLLFGHHRIRETYYIDAFVQHARSKFLRKPGVV
jgi:hypothetical protein